MDGGRVLKEGGRVFVEDERFVYTKVITVISSNASLLGS